MSVEVRPVMISSEIATPLGGARVKPNMPWPAPTTTLLHRFGLPMKGRSVGAHRSGSGPGVEPFVPIEIEELAHRRDDHLDAAAVERRVIPAELHRAAEADPILERCGDRVHFLEDDRLLQAGRRW